MNKLVSTTQAAKILGLSLQGVHYRIKNNKLNSIQKDGKTFVYVDESLESKEEKTNQNFINNKIVENNNLLLKEKDKQIKLLKKSIKWMDKQYKSEIHRLEMNQNKIIEVFNSEIKLLQSAFNEMRSIYQIENNKTVTKEQELITVKDFFILMKKYGKTNNQIKAIIIKAIKSKDSRFIYNKDEKTILILKNKFEDLN
ncbi:MAG: DNA-binding protein [Sulfurovum sp.]